LLLQLKRPKLDYIILFTAFLLIASNQVFETTPLGATGMIEITNGSAIPKDTNYTLTSVSVPSVSSAVLINESLLIDNIYTNMPFDHTNRIVCNITLQSSSEYTPIRISARFGEYTTYFDVIAGIIPQTFSIKPNMDLVHASGWIDECQISTSKNIDMSLQNVVVWAEFDTLLSPIVFDLRSTDGQELYDSESPRSSLYSGPLLTINRHQDGSTGSLYFAFQNRTLYLPSLNYTFTTTWAYSSYPLIQFNITVQPDMKSVCRIHLFVIRIDFEINPDFPFLRLELRQDDDPFPTYYREFHYSQFPKYVFVHANYRFKIEVDSLNPLSQSSHYTRELFASGQYLLNGSHHLNAKVTMPYIALMGLYITPQDLIQIVIAIVLFSLFILRIFIYFKDIKHRVSWRDPRLIPIVLLGLTAFIPWFSATNISSGTLNASVNITSFGVFPLIVGWTNSGSIFLALPSSGINWAIASLMLFWIPLLYANYSLTPPSILDNNYLASLVLFSPILFTDVVHYGLALLYSYPFTPSIIIQIIQISIPLLFLCSLVFLRWTGNFDYGLSKNQLALDVNLAEQLVEKKDSVEITDSQKSFVDEKPLPSPIEVEARKTLNLVLVILQFLFFLIPTSVGFYMERIWPTDEYAIYRIYIGNPINSVGVFLESAIGNPGASAFWMLIIPSYYLFTFGFLGEFSMKSRKVLSFIFFVLWVSVPLLVFTTFSVIHYYYVGVEWILVSLPYYLLTCVTVMKLGMFVKGEIRFSSLFVWILIPVIFIIPGGLILNLLANMQRASLTGIVFDWVPLPIATILLITILWPLRYWYRRTLLNLEVDIEVNEMIHSDNMGGELG